MEQEAVAAAAALSNIRWPLLILSRPSSLRQVTLTQPYLTNPLRPYDHNLPLLTYPLYRALFSPRYLPLTLSYIPRPSLFFSIPRDIYQSKQEGRSVYINNPGSTNANIKGYQHQDQEMARDDWMIYSCSIDWWIDWWIDSIHHHSLVKSKVADWFVGY